MTLRFIVFKPPCRTNSLSHSLIYIYICCWASYSSEFVSTERGVGRATASYAGFQKLICAGSMFVFAQNAFTPFLWQVTLILQDLETLFDNTCIYHHIICNIRATVCVCVCVCVQMYACGVRSYVPRWKFWNNVARRYYLWSTSFNGIYWSIFR